MIKITEGVFGCAFSTSRFLWFVLGLKQNMLLKTHLLCLGTRLLWQEDCVDVWQDTALGDGDAAHELVELFVVSDGELQVSRRDSGLLVVSGCVACKFQDLGGEVFKDGCEVHWGACTDSGTVGAELEVTVDTSDWELESSTG